MIKKLFLLLIILPLIFFINSCGNGAGSGYNPPGNGPGQPTYIKLLPARYVAQTNGCIELYAEVHDENGEVLANIPVTFTNLSEPFGQLLDRCSGTEVAPPVRVNTDSWGRAKVTLYSTTPGFATLLAQVYTGGQPRDRKTVLFSQCDTYECLVLAPSLQLDVDSEPPDGILNESQDFIIFDPDNLPDDKANLYATVMDRYGSPIPYNAHVVWGSDHAEAVFTRIEDLTNENGQVTAQVEFIPSSLRGTETHVNVWAYSDNVSDFVLPFDIVTFFLQPVTIASIIVSANPSVVQPEGTSTINATITLNTGDLVPDGVSVIFTTCDAATCTMPCGIVNPFAQTIGGEATAQFTAPALPDTCRVNARVNSSTGFTDILVTDDLAVTPDSIDVNGTVGGTAMFTIYNGTAPYTVVSDSSNTALDPNPATVVNSGDTFTITVPAGTADTTVTYTIRDSIGNKVTATLDISTDALAVLPSSITVDRVAGSGGPITFTIYGGAPGYTILADTNDPTLQPTPTTIANSGDTFTVTVPAGTAATTVTYTVRDSAGDTVDAMLNITADALTVLPSSVSINGTVGGIATFNVYGGAPGYTIITNDPSLPPDTTTVTNSGDPFTVTVPAGTESGTVTYTIRDSAGTAVTATVNISTDAIAVLPSLITVDGVAGSGGPITFTIYGGSPGYTIISDTTDLTLQPTPTTIANSGGTFTVTVPAGTAATTVTYTVRDSAGDTVDATLTITVLSLDVQPSSTTVGPGDSAGYSIIGGIGPFTVSTSHPAITNVDGNPPPFTLGPGVTTFTINDIGSVTDTNVAITVVDSVGATDTATFVVDWP